MSEPSDSDPTMAPPPGFKQTWAAVAAQFDGVDPDPGESLRTVDASAVPAGYALDVQTLPLLSVSEGEAVSELTTQKLLGEGGMGKVELAIQRSLQREVAIKSTLGADDDTQADALLQEARVTGLLEHPNIVPVHQLGRGRDDRPLLVMKRVEGVSWKALIRDPEHPHWKTLGDDRLREHIGILISVCNAVEFAHARSVLHRDIKPANVMVGAFGEVYLLDWGLAMRLDPRPESTAVVGTPAQMAPEMLDGARDVDERTDVYLLGAALHTALTGSSRHQGTSFPNLCYAIFKSTPIDYPSDVPSELAALCNQATHADPAQRPQSAAEFRRALERYLEHRSSIALAAETATKLPELRALLSDQDPDRERLAALSAECRFGFGQALRAWPENAAARDGLQECLRLLIERELAQQNLGLAKALIAELPLPAPELLARLDALQEEQATLQARMRELEQQGDWRQSAAARLVFFGGLLAVAVGLMLWINDGKVRNERTLTPEQLATGATAVLLALAVMVFLGRNYLLTNQVNRRLVYGALLTGAAIALNRIVRCIPAPPTASLISTEVVLCAYGSAMGALLLAPWLWLQVPIWVVGAFATRLIPEYAGLIFAVTALIALGVAAYNVHAATRGSNSLRLDDDSRVV